jgi:acetyl esterase/lipase
MRVYKSALSIRNYFHDLCYNHAFATFKLPSNRYHPNLPVMIFIHGGSFAFSSGSSFGPAYLLDRDVILVTFNYRLSSFGNKAILIHDLEFGTVIHDAFSNTQKKSVFDMNIL